MSSKLTKKQLKEFGLLIGFGFPIILGWILPMIWGHNFRFWTLWIGIISLLITVFNPNLLEKPYRFWMKIGYYLGWINSKIILGIVFVFVLIPISFSMKLFGYDPLRIKNKTLKSFREDTKDHKIDLKRIF